MSEVIGSVDLQQHPLQSKFDQIASVAQDLYAQDPSWVTFFREVLGLSGAAHSLFKENDEFEAFRRSDSYAKINGLLANLRMKDGATENNSEPTKVITVRLPKSLHETLREEARSRRTSMNQLCVSKLLQDLR